jgi:hypothetical protein
MSRGFKVGLTAVLVIAASPAWPEPRGAHVLDLGPLYSAAVGLAVEGAVRRLHSAECRLIFADFHDSSGALLQDRLDAEGVSAPDYVRRLVFTDGFAHRSCRTGDALALTSPGNRVVYVCGPRFQKAQARSPRTTEIVVLHEALHTLGLGENPPDSTEITRHVEARCAR